MKPSGVHKEVTTQDIRPNAIKGTQKFIDNYNKPLANRRRHEAELYFRERSDSSSSPVGVRIKPDKHITDHKKVLGIEEVYLTPDTRKKAIKGAIDL